MTMVEPMKELSELSSTTERRGYNKRLSKRRSYIILPGYFGTLVLLMNGLFIGRGHTFPIADERSIIIGCG